MVAYGPMGEVPPHQPVAFQVADKRGKIPSVVRISRLGARNASSRRRPHHVVAGRPCNTFPLTGRDAKVLHINRQLSGPLRFRGMSERQRARVQ